MKQTIHTSSLLTSHSSAEGCPIESEQKTVPAQEEAFTDSPLERDTKGVWHVRSFALIRTILRGSETRQAGFGAENMQHAPPQMRRPILYEEGQQHHQQRKQTARFFTPKAVSTNYRALMERVADKMAEELQRTRKVNLSDLSLELSVQVVGEVVGLTSSRLPGMSKRLDAFFDNSTPLSRWRILSFLHFFHVRSRLLAFFLLDVKPAIQAHRKQPREDVISHLLEQNYSDVEILTECLTFAAAGMATTREFISVALWHLLERPELRARYLVAPEEERYAILGEILRLEPVIGHLYRRASSDLLIEHEGEKIVIAKGDKIDLHIREANIDTSIVGNHPLKLCPARELYSERVPAELMSFGDGHHRCPGSYVAFQETDILLLRLLALDGLRIRKEPDVTWSELVAGYELRKFIVELPGISPA